MQMVNKQYNFCSCMGVNITFGIGSKMVDFNIAEYKPNS